MFRVYFLLLYKIKKTKFQLENHFLLYYFYLVWGVEDDFGFIAIEFDLSRDDNGFAFK
jgi:hypothetical protein